MKLKNKCCEKYKKKAAYCKECPLPHQLGDEELLKRLKKAKKKLKKRKK